MTTAFHRFAWGILFVLLDFRVVYLDVLPDTIGFAFMWSAINILGRLRGEYIRARPYAVTLSFLTIPELILLEGEDTSTRLGASIPQLASVSLMALLMMFLMHRFFTALSQHASDSGANEFAAATRSRRTLFLTVSAGSLILFPFMLNMESSVASFWSTAAGVLNIVALLLLFTTCRRAPSEIQGD